jgi:hypothetical protein
MDSKSGLLVRVIVISLSALGGTATFFARGAAENGTVTGIVFSADNPTAVIDEQIVSTGESIYGVTIVNIGEDYVEFEKDNERWQQRIREKPNSRWR